MKKLIGVIVFVALFACSANLKAEDLQTGQKEKISLSSKVPISFYGFIEAETLYSDSQLSSFGTPNNTPASYNRTIGGFNRVVDEKVEGKNDANVGFTPQNTRLGFSLDPYDFGSKNFKVDGRIEMDFFATGDTLSSSIRPRLRRAYAGIGSGRWHLLFGQEWDLYSPLNTATLNIGANLWRQGNQGFRRPQIAATYTQPVVEEINVEFAGSVNLPGNSLNMNDNGNTTGMPMFEGRVGFLQEIKNGIFKVYISGAYARHTNQVAGMANVNNWAVAGSIEAPLHDYLTLDGEIHYGYSMDMMQSNSQDTARQRFVAGWGQVKSKWLEWFETNAGFGFEKVRSYQVPAGWIKDNYNGYANFLFKPIKDVFIIGLEYNHLMTNYQGDGFSQADVGLLSALFFF